MDTKAAKASLLLMIAIFLIALSAIGILVIEITEPKNELMAFWILFFQMMALAFMVANIITLRRLRKQQKSRAG